MAGPTAVSELIVKTLSDHGPWVLLVFYLLYRDFEKDKLTRGIVERNTRILTEMSTIIRERLPAE